ncbi:MAG: S41 family peptidase, partial [Candidatus Omnitrophota bacterium]
GYIRIVEFRETTPGDLEDAISKIRSQGMDSLIIDLRNNPGGLLEIAIRATEMFIEPGKIIVYTKGRTPDQNLEFTSRNKNPYLDWPMVILVNEGSASGSEIMAGALQDYKRAIILGTKTFGKGSVQTVIPLSDGSALRLTTSRYFTPSGKIIHEKGIEPDITVELITEYKTEKTESKTQKREEMFDGLEEKIDQEIPRDYQKDNQLMRAVDLLKGIKVYSKTRDEK